ncbi:MAG TPA: class I SAM-dependent methyltransferase, partial [Gemmatimonadales bacterium]
MSLDLIHGTGVARTDPILDVGGGASQLVDHLMALGHTDVSVLDIAPAALEKARARLGPAAKQVEWIAADVTTFQPLRRYTVWHDRGVFHFLVTPSDRMSYLKALVAALAPQGHLVLATFGPQGPLRCSGLPVQRYSEDDIGALLGSQFQLRSSEIENHLTPSGQEQQL